LARTRNLGIPDVPYFRWREAARTAAETFKGQPGYVALQNEPMAAI
jgi:hypothetical protein